MPIGRRCVLNSPFALYNNLLFGPVQATGGSTSVANSFDQLRKAAAAARAMMIAAAAQDWNLPTSEITITKGIVGHASSGRRAAFGELADKAAALPVPSEVKLKEPKDWIYIGKHVPRINSVAKTTGAARYALDVKRPGMLTAVVARSPLLRRRSQVFRRERRQGDRRRR